MRARGGTASDYRDFVRLYAELGVPDPTPTEAWFSHYAESTTFLLDESDRPIAYSIAFPMGEGNGFVMHVVVDPSMRNRGVGRGLMDAVRGRLRAQGCTEWSLNVRDTNAAAIALYRRCGMEIKSPTLSLHMPWSAVELLPREPIHVEAHDASRDADIERALRLPPGRMTRAREVPGRIAKTAPGGVIVFDPAFPGCPLFRASAPAVARALIESVRAHRKPEHDALRVTFENDQELAKVFLAVGAHVVLSLVHMRGPL